MQRPRPVPSSPRPAPAPGDGRRSALGRLLAWGAGPLLGLAGCATGFPDAPPANDSASARRHLDAAAEAAGLAHWRRLQMLALELDALPSPTGGGSLLPGPWRLLLEPPAGRQQASRADGTRSEPPGLAAAAALQALMLLWPLQLAGAGVPVGPVHWAEPQTLDGQRCDHLHLPQPPAASGAARLSLFIDRDALRLRRLLWQGAGSQALLSVDLAGHRETEGLTLAHMFRLNGREARWALAVRDLRLAPAG